jgi:hypothetical protein
LSGGNAFFISGWFLGAQNVGTLSPGEALEMAKNPGTHIIDVRSIAEYVLIGHPVDATEGYPVRLTIGNPAPLVSNKLDRYPSPNWS